MKKILKKFIPFIMLLTLSLSQAFAADGTFSDSIYGEIEKGRNFVERVEASSEETGSASWYLNIIRVKFNASVGVKVPWLAGLSISPFVELFFVR